MAFPYPSGASVMAALVLGSAGAPGVHITSFASLSSRSDESVERVKCRLIGGC
jgi:hypothetical protein